MANGITKNTPDSSTDSADIVFPPSLRTILDRPCIEFSAKVKDGKDRKIWLPCPPNIAINDRAEYTTIDLGTIGGAVASAANAAGAANDLGGMVSNIAKSIASQATSMKGSDIMALAAGKTAFGDQAKFAAKIVNNPNTNTTFTRNSVRSFSFQFRLVATSAEEAKIIRRLHNRFRTFTYADSRNNSQNIILEYPPVWTIKFLDPQLKENPFIPKIYSCYLGSVSTNINSSTSVFHIDGAPLEVDVQIEFQETRALTRQDILDLEKGLLPNRGVSEDGTPSVQSNTRATQQPTEQSTPTSAAPTGQTTGGT